ncbi:MAG: ABC transporter permease, partial [Burkholderiales bacterium]
GSTSVLGRSIRIDGHEHTIIGVLPKASGFPERDRQLWIPLLVSEVERSLAEAGSFTDIRAVARLKAGQSMPAAAAEMTRLVRAEPALAGIANEIGLEFAAKPIRYVWIGEREFSLKLMLLAVLIVFVVTAANICNLYLLRLLKRRQEMALLEAVGASYGRRLRQICCEVLLLCLAGACAVSALLPLGLALLRHFDVLPVGVPQVIGADLATLAFIVAMTVLLAMVMVMVSSGLGLQRQNIYEVLRQTGNGQTAGPRAHRLRQVLVVGQVVLTLVLLFGAALLLRSSYLLLNEDVGFERTSLLVGQLRPLDVTSLLDTERQRASLANWAATTQSMPGVEAVAMASTAPFGENVSVTPFVPSGNVSANQRSQPGAYTTFVSNDYFRALQLPILRGRSFTESETRTGAAVAVIDADLARRYFDGVDPLDQFVSIGENGKSVELRVVGVAATARQRSLQDRDEYPTMYRPSEVPYRLESVPVDEVEVVILARQAPHAVLAPLQAQLGRLAPDFRFAQLITMEQRIADTIKDRLRLNALLQIFAAIATLLAAIGIYALLSYSVTMRSREFGVRQALGADRLHVMGVVFGQGLKLLGIAMFVALPVSYLLGLLLSPQLYRVGALDPLSLLGVFCVFGLIGIIANWGPARRAAKISPMDALRSD